MTLRISDRALVRFLQRAGGLDVEGVRAHLSSSLERAVKSAADLGQRDYAVMVDGLAYVVRDGILTTVQHDYDGSKKLRGGAR